MTSKEDASFSKEDDASDDEIAEVPEASEGDISDEAGDSEDDISEGSEGESSDVSEVEDCDVLEQQEEIPNDIDLDSVAVGLCVHPHKNIVATGTIDGPVHLYNYGKEGNSHLITYEHLKKPCRAVAFSDSGNYLFTGSNDRLIQVIDLETNSVRNVFKRPNGAPIYSLLPINDYMLASGDDDGEVVIWDFRKQLPIVCFEDCSDYISSFAVNENKKVLLAASGDGSLTVFNLRSRKMELQSEFPDCEFSSIGLVKQGKNVVIGSDKGSLYIFNWGEWGDVSSTFSAHRGSVDCLVAVDNEVICTGCDDGRIRACQIFPNRFLGIVGSHGGFPIESLGVSPDKTLLLSISNDQKIRFWDLTCLAQAKAEKVSKCTNKQKQLRPPTNFFAGLA